MEEDDFVWVFLLDLTVLFAHWCDSIKDLLLYRFIVGVPMVDFINNKAFGFWLPLHINKELMLNQKSPNSQ